MSVSRDVPPIVERCFRRDYARLVAILTRRLGVQHIDVVEDAVQSALMAALTTWPSQSIPEDPSAWVFRTAYNRAVEELRRQVRRLKIAERDAVTHGELASLPDEPVGPDEIRDDLLRMLFVCCDEAIPWESRLVLALKTLCGLSTAEIALRLFTSEANVYKRLARARERLRGGSVEVHTPPVEVLRSRLPAVHDVLYLLFNEGYLAAHPDHAIRKELCAEAIRLTTLLSEHPVGAVPATFALLALMYFHVARLDARVDDVGGLILLENQDRSLWDREGIACGAAWLARSANGAQFTRFHAEAAIAAEHCFAPSFRETRWEAIADLYAMLERVAPSPLHTLNRALAVAELRGPAAGLAVLDGLVPPSWLSGSYLWNAVRSDLHRRAGHADLARLHAEGAVGAAPTVAVQAALRRRLCGERPDS
ncbi:MAG TPA: sigma-70 family RNA polymerase sigma factor [Gemmatimonadaceae bacterium]|nr:sigma-70 family RNA polymerase sigma factor [Gemmatimonadaceae bacterium]